MIKSSKVAHLNDLPDKLPKSSHKYGAKAMMVDGIRFPSMKEAKRYTTLKALEKAHLISNLKIQVPYELNPGGTHSLKYIADFVYTNDKGEQIVEDSKGYKTREYKKKKKLMLEVHNISITES